MKRRKLTKRDKDVVDLLIRGYTDKQIARALGIALRTAKHHVRMACQFYEVDRSIHAPRVRLATLRIYQKNPELAPYFDGDRTSRFGLPSACDYLRTLDETEAYREGGATPRGTTKR